MIPSDHKIRELWDEFQLPLYKRNHCLLVARVAVWFAKQLSTKKTFVIDKKLLWASALLHDIDKSIPNQEGERHPDAGVRVLREKGFIDVSDLVRTHPLHAILDPSIAPKTIEEKLLYLADKMVKHTIITVDERFALWRREQLPVKALTVLDAAYPKVKELENHICAMIGVKPQAIASLVNSEDLSTIGGV